MSNLQDSELKKILSQILDELKTISQNLQSIKSSLDSSSVGSLEITNSNAPISDSSRSDELTSMPSSLEILNLQESRPGIFKTYKAIQKKVDWVKSADIADMTSRSRGLESRYLNYLAQKGFVMKKREKIESDSRATEVWYRIVGANS
ncbi:MAG: hypothetical protein ACW99R_13930 [Candidatus Hodarchaeales archaeon]|jgi:hypothetical protein